MVPVSVTVYTGATQYLCRRVFGRGPGAWGEDPRTLTSDGRGERTFRSRRPRTSRVARSLCTSTVG